MSDTIDKEVAANEEKYKDIEWLPKTQDGQRIYPTKTIWVVERDVDFHHQSGRSVEWYRPFKHEVRCFWVSNGEDTEIGVSSCEEYMASECFGDRDKAQEKADEENKFHFEDY